MGNEQMVIVDGNNVMGQRVGWHRNKSAAQQQLIDEVEHITYLRDEPHILVFDAKPNSTVPDEWNRSQLTVQYARPGCSADELILELVYGHGQHSEVTVVTSDRALTRQIHVLGAKVIRSGAFRKMLELKIALKKQSQVLRLKQSANCDLGHVTCDLRRIAFHPSSDASPGA